MVTMAEIKWKFRHFLKDGNELKPGMQIPMTKENMATIERVYNICVEARQRREAQVLAQY